MCKIVSLLFIALLAVEGSADGPAQPAHQSGRSPTNESAPPSYCGVYSLHRATRALAHDTPFSEWLKPEYIGSREGSSLSDLVRAATEHGLHSEPMRRMTCFMLRHSRCPVILHVKNDMATAKAYNHWILFMGTEDGKARIYDGVYPLELVEFSDLAARWDGIGLLISTDQYSVSSLWLVVAAQFVFYTGSCASVIALLLWLKHRLTGRERSEGFCSLGWRRCILELAMLLALALVLGAGCRWVHVGGFLSHTASLAAIQDMHMAGFLAKVKVEDVPMLLDAEGVSIVDARLPQDFVEGHLADAINIPPDSSPQQCQKALAGVPESSRILLYCQSNGCPYSEIVARKLIALGYSNILYFRDGWIAWEKYQQKNAP